MLIEDGKLLLIYRIKQKDDTVDECSSCGGIVGTGYGPEFTDPSYVSKEKYFAEMISIQDVADGKIKMV